MIQNNKQFVSIIIPTLNRDKVLIETLESILKQKYPNFEIITVDQSDKIYAPLEKFIKGHKQIKYIHIREKGTSNAKNVGAKQSKGQILIFLDDDVLIDDENFIAYHVANYKDKYIGAIGGRVLMKPFRDVNQIKEVGKLKYFGLKEITNFDANFRTQIDHVYGCNQSYRKDVFDKVGGFAKVYEGNAHLEEADLSMRVKRVGYKIFFDPKACLLHLHVQFGGCRTKDVYELRYWIIHNYTIFYLRHYSKLLFPVYFIKQIIWSIFSSLKRFDIKMFRTMVGALFDGIKYYKKINQ